MTAWSGGQERAPAEAWFAHHGLPWFVDDIRDEVAGRLTRPRVAVVGLLAAVIGVGTGLLVMPPRSRRSLPLQASVRRRSLVVYAMGALHATPIARWALRRALRSFGLLLRSRRARCRS